MNIPVWALIVAPPVFASLGFLICGILIAGKDADASDGAESIMHWQRMWKHALDTSRDNAAAHSRCADALSTTQRKLSAIRDLINKPETVRKGVLSAILDGDAL